MAQVILSSVGSALGGPLGGAFGRLAGSLVDRAAIDALSPARQVGPRLAGLQLQSTAEGAPMACVFGRMRVTGQIIWAARFKERRIEQSSGGSKGGPRTVSYAYSLSFAVALCEGPIYGVGRVWADGQVMDMTGVTMRLHTGAVDQTPDPLIEAVEATAPAYRGVAYVVFEGLPLGAYGDRPPQLMFEVFRRPRGATPSLEDRLGSVCLIPGAGEFVYATTPVLRRDGLTVSTAENVNNPSGGADIEAALDQLAAQLPNVPSVTLVVAWFGDDLRCGHCSIRPGVEQAEKSTIPFVWRAGGVDRGHAHLLSRHGGGPAYGGTPSDQTVIQAIQSLKSRGYAVTLYPFLLMDIAGGNGLPDPYGGAEQGAYPWRGRITGEPGADKTSAAGAQISSFFGSAAASDFSVAADGVDYHGPDEWSFRRFILANAHLAEAAGGVHSFLIGSEMRGVTTLRSDASTFPAVAALQSLAADCAGVLRAGTQIGYAADWTEYNGHQPADGTGDVLFHLDPLWSDPHVSFVGVDWYAPLADWRDGGEHLDALTGFGGPYDVAYLAANVAGGEGFDWYYASPADRLAQTRTQITDGAYDEPWVFRPKDLASWWSNAHHDRPGGVRNAAPTSWASGLKPIRFTEFGCPAVDKGSNAPNLFVDAKSAESALPPFSNGDRDDLAQRRALEALLAWFADPAHVPVIAGVSMIDPALMAAWCWDARPFPDFPARTGVWADALNWARGHWLNGRMGASEAADLIAAILSRGGISLADLDLSDAHGLIDGYLLERPMKLADALAPLAIACAFDLAERGGRIGTADRDALVPFSLGQGALALPEGKPADLAPSRALKPLPDVLNVRFIDGAGDYKTGAIAVRADGAGGAGAAALDLPILTTSNAAARIGARQLRRLTAERDTATLYVSPHTALVAEPGDVVLVGDDPKPWRVTRSDADEAPRLSLVRLEAPDTEGAVDEAYTTAAPARPWGPPALILLDMPPLEGMEEDARPLVAIAADPWRRFDMSAGPSADALTPRATANDAAVIGQTLNALAPGPLYRFDRANRLQVRIEGGTLSSASEAAVLNGANPLAVLADNGEWEVIQYLSAELIAPGVYVLSGLLRGQSGSGSSAAAGASAGASVVVLDSYLVRATISQSERGLPLTWRAAPSGGAAGGLAMTEVEFTWSALALRPYAPAHLQARRLADGTLRFAWIRRTRIGGDPWTSGEVPLSEANEGYRLDIFADGAVVRSLTVEEPTADYGVGDQATDFPGGMPWPLMVEVRQGSDIYGWGAALRRPV
jgi:hypothetical protein